MAVALGAPGTVASAAAQTLNVPYPTGVTAGDALVLTRFAKSETTVFTTPSGWTLLDDRVGGTGVLGNDTGQVRAARYWREAAGTETGTLTVDTTPGTVDVQQAVINRYTKGPGATWSVAASGGSDSTTGTDWSVTAATNPGVTAGDVVEVGLSWPTDAARTWSNEVLSATGVTFGTVMVPLVVGTTALGADLACRLHAYQCAAGTATAPPVYTATVNSGTNIAGPTSFVRLREVATNSTGVLVATLPAVTAAATGTTLTAGTTTAALGALTASFTGMVTATGTVTRPDTGTVTRPATSVVVRPDTGTVTRP